MMTWFLDFPSLQKCVSETTFLLLLSTEYVQFGTPFGSPRTWRNEWETDQQSQSWTITHYSLTWRKKQIQLQKCCIIFGTPDNDQTPKPKQSYVQHTTVRTLQN